MSNTASKPPTNNEAAKARNGRSHPILSFCSLSRNEGFVPTNRRSRAGRVHRHGPQPCQSCGRGGVQIVIVRIGIDRIHNLFLSLELGEPRSQVHSSIYFLISPQSLSPAVAACSASICPSPRWTRDLIVPTGNLKNVRGILLIYLLDIDQQRASVESLPAIPEARRSLADRKNAFNTSSGRSQRNILIGRFRVGRPRPDRPPKASRLVIPTSGGGRPQSVDSAFRRRIVSSPRLHVGPDGEAVDTP